MSGSQKSSRPSQQQNPCLTQPSSDPTTAAEKLQKRAQTRLNHSTTMEMDPLEDADEPAHVSCPIEEGYQRGEFHEEIRCFRLPRAIVQREYALLQEHRLKKFHHLVSRVYEDLSGTLLLMRHLDAAAELCSYDLSLIRQNLSRPVALLDTICSQPADCELVKKTTVPA